MLTIDARQLKALQDNKELSAAQRLRDYFSEQFAELAKQYPERTDVKVIMRSFAVAERYGFGSDEQKCQFALLAFVLGEGFELEPRNHAVLTEGLWHPDTRLTHLIAWVEHQAQKSAASKR